VLPIQKKLIKYNFSSGNSPEYIVVHDTGNTGKGADAEAHFKYFNGGDRQSSAHYFVDDHSIIQTVEDYNASWHCGDGKGKYGITNYNSIGIEICINSDGDYDKAVGNAIDLVKFLMQKYSIPIDRVVRHYDASRKNCPGTMSANNWAKWTWFKAQLSEPTTHWAEKYYRFLTEEKGIVIHERRFDDTITRGEIFAVMARMMGYKE
jgi:N-acetylmuramoyl-L-alanine amidase CwlA